MFVYVCVCVCVFGLNFAFNKRTVSGSEVICIRHHAKHLKMGIEYPDRRRDKVRI